MWYPQNKRELEKTLKEYVSVKPTIRLEKVHGILVPHAGYEYSGEIAGKAFSMLNSQKKAIVLSPSHYEYLQGVATHNEEEWKTPLGKIKITPNKFPKRNISQEHAIDNQIPFLQDLGFEEVLPLVVGQIGLSEAKSLAEQLEKHIDNKTILVLSTDLSHFHSYDYAVKIDKQTINIIKRLDQPNANKIEACGIYPLLIFMELCKKNSWTPKLIEYKNSGDITGDLSQVVGYASFWF